MSVSKFNHEGYYDPTTYTALSNIEAEERKARFRPVVYVCSPFSGNLESNVENTRRYCRFAVDSGFVPFAPHLLFPQFLFMGIVMLTKCAELWVFGERISKGMSKEIHKAEARNMLIRYFTTNCEEVQK